MIGTVRHSWFPAGVLLVALLLASSLMSLGLAAAAPLGQATTGTITGQVLSLDDVPLPNVRLAAYSESQSTPNRTPLAEFQSDAQGHYSIQVPAGTVWTSFLTQDIGGQSFWGYDNLPVQVAAGQTVSGQDFRVAIRVVSAPPVVAQPTAVPPTTIVVPGMPTTGTGPNLLLPLAGGLGFVLLLFGLALRRRVPR